MAVFTTRWGAVSGGGGLGVGGIRIDRDLTIPAAFERDAQVIRLKHWTNFGFLATDYDMLSAQPQGWNLYDTGSKTGTAVANASGTGDLVVTADGTTHDAARWYATRHEGFGLFKDHAYGWRPGSEFVFHLAVGVFTPHSEEAGGVGLMGGNSYEGASPNFPRNEGMYFDLGYTNNNFRWRARNDTGTSPTMITDASKNEAGVWFLLRHEGQYCTWWYDMTDSADSPYAANRPWTITAKNNIVPPRDTGAPMQWGCFLANYVVGIHDQVMTISHMEHLSDDKTGTNCGTSTGDQDITLIANSPIGASTTLADSALNAALRAATNTRRWDSASVRFSAIRSSGTPAASTYQSIGSVAVGGTGANFGLFARFNGPGDEAASIHDDLFIPLKA